MADRFTDELWQGSADIYDAILAHPFVTGLADGSLAPSERALVHRHFRATSRYEWMFWDMGYRQENWPV